jgi:hypothetical protein
MSSLQLEWLQVMYDMKAEMDALCRALQQAGICVDAPHQNKTKEQHINGNQKSKFVRIAKKVNWSKNTATKYPTNFLKLTPKMNPMRAATWQLQ